MEKLKEAYVAKNPGVTIEVQQSDSSTGRQYGGAIGYASGPLALRVAYNSKNTDVDATATSPAGTPSRQACEAK